MDESSSFLFVKKLRKLKISAAPHIEASLLPSPPTTTWNHAPFSHLRICSACRAKKDSGIDGTHTHTPDEPLMMLHFSHFLLHSPLPSLSSAPWAVSVLGFLSLSRCCIIHEEIEPGPKNRSHHTNTESRGFYTYTYPFKHGGVWPVGFKIECHGSLYVCV